MPGGLLTLFLGGDVMTGRGVDQILPHPGDPVLRESYVRDARDYVALAEALNGDVPHPADYRWPWGDALAALDDAAPDLRVINLETTVTRNDEFAPGKSVHYRMNPDNLGCLTVAKPDVCTLANNHTLDFGHRGLADTLAALAAAGIDAAGAGLDQERARAPVRLTTEAGTTVLITSLGVASSGIPAAWAATAQRAGVYFLPDLATDSVADVAARLQAAKRPGEIAVASVHMGSNWDWTVSRDQVRFAHALIDAGVDVVHGHSSHHPRPIEVYRGKLILYGCGDLIDDYEGITGYERYRDDLRLLYIATLDPHRGTLVRLEMTPMQTCRLRLQRASSSDGEWLRSALERASRDFGARFSRRSDGRIVLSRPPGPFA